jgi:hypothetical protein
MQMNHLRGQTTRGTTSSQTPSYCKKITNMKKEGPRKRTPSLDKPSPTTTTCFKIETTCAQYNAIDTFYL